MEVGLASGPRARAAVRSKWSSRIGRPGVSSSDAEYPERLVAGQKSEIAVLGCEPEAVGAVLGAHVAGDTGDVVGGR